MFTTDSVLQDAGVALLAILAISSLMVPNISCMYWAGYFLLTLEAGVIAVLKFALDADFDTIASATIMITVSFAVDCLLHVTHCYN